jgi:hypothetical protein
MNTIPSLISATAFLLTVILPGNAFCVSPRNIDDLDGSIMLPSFDRHYDSRYVLPKTSIKKIPPKIEKPFLLRDPSLSAIYTPPPNDNFVDRIAVVGDYATVNGNNISATLEPGEPELHAQRGSNSVWWTWTPSAPGICVIDTDGSSFDTYLAVYTGDSISNLTEVARDDDSGMGLQSKVMYPHTPGSTYQIAVFGYSPASEGTITLNCNILPPPPNDNFADAIMISGTSGNTTGYNVFATSEAGELPGMPSGNGHNSVWWKWTAPSDGTYSFNTFGSDYDTVLGVFTGSSVDTLTRQTWNDDSGSLQSYVYFNANAGATYYISVAGYGDYSEGSIDLNWQSDQIFWYGSQVVTGIYGNAFYAANGNLLTYSSYAYTTIYDGSNLYGTSVSTYSNRYNIGDVKVKDKKNNEVVTADTIDTGITGSYNVVDYDGKQALIYNDNQANSSPGSLLMYKVSKKGFTRAGAYRVKSNHSYAWMTKSWVYQRQYDWGANQEHIVALHRRLKKPLWKASLLPDGAYYNAYNNGVVASYRVNGSMINVEVTKKGKPYGSHILSADNFRVNEKGSIIYWTYTATGAGPMTLISRKGKVLTDNFSLGSMTNFGYCWYSGKLLYLRSTVDGSNTTIRTYTVTSKFKLNGEKTGIMNYAGASMSGSRVYVYLYGSGYDQTVLEYKKKLDNVAWQNTGPTFWYDPLGNGSFCRVYGPAPGTYTYTIIKQDKDIATHQYTVP